MSKVNSNRDFDTGRTRSTIGDNYQPYGIQDINATRLTTEVQDDRQKRIV